MRDRRPYGLFTSIFLMMFLLPVVTHAQNEVPINKDGSKQSISFIENKGQIIDQFYKPNPGVLYLLNTQGLNVQLRETGFSYDLYRISDQIESNRQKTLGNCSSTVTRYPPLDSAPVIKFHRIDFDLLNTDPAYTIIPFNPDSEYRNYYTDGLPVMGITNVRSYVSILYKNIYPGTDLEFIRDEKNSFKYNFILHPGADPERISLRIKGVSIVVNPSGSLRLETELGIIDEKIPECYYEIDGIKFPISGSFKKVSDSVFGFAFDKAIPTSALIVIDPTPTRVWGTYYGGVSDDYGTGCSVDEAGNVFMTGYTSSPGNIATSGSFQSDLEGGMDAFIVKFSPSGIRQWGTYYGGNAQETGAQSTVDKAGNIYIAGMANPGSNVATPGCFQFTCGGLTDAFLAKFSTNGYRIWSTFYGGSGWDGGVGLEGTKIYCKTDSNCNIFLSFPVNSDLLATPGTYREHPYNVPDCILAEFDSSGQRKWATYFGGEDDDWPYSCAPDNLGHVYLSGSTKSTSQIATPGSHQEFLGGQSDCFLARFDTLGQLEWATYYGGTTYEGYGFCSAGTNGEVYLCGQTASSNNISTPGSHQENLNGVRDAFLVKFNSSGVRQWGTYYGGTGMDDAFSVTLDKNGNILLTGPTTSTDNIATPGSYQPVLAGGTDAFLAKYTPGGQRLWGTYYGGSLEDQGWDVCTDQNTNIYVAGLTQSTNNIASSNGAQNTYGGGQEDGFLVKFEDCPIPSTAGAINGPVSICIPQTGVVYSVPVINYATGYVWS
ncbi:MAG: SBBP repeat-containing protein, partial [Bacteroidota bacterium]